MSGIDRKIKRSIERSKKKNIKYINIAWIITAVAGLLMTVCVIYMATTYGKLSIKKEISELYDWETLTNNLGDINVDIVEYDGIITANEYMEVRKRNAITNINDISALIGKKYTDYMVDGINSDYFTGIVLKEYSDFEQSALNMLHEALHIEELYKSYIGDTEAKEFGCSSKDCSMYEFISTSYRDDSLEYMLKVHNMYEALIEYYEGIVEVSDDDLNYFYQTEICSNTKYIKDIDIKVYTLTGKALELDKADVQYAYKKGWIPYTRLNKSNGDVLDYLQLCKDIDFYDSNIISKAYATMYSIFGEVNGDTKIVNITDVENVEEYLKNIEASSKSNEDEDILVDKITFDTLSISDENSGEQIYIIFDVISCEHNDVPSLDDIRDEIEVTAKRYLAEQRLTEDIESIECEHEESEESK